jgi:hypothetical protein
MRGAFRPRRSVNGPFADIDKLPKTVIVVTNILRQSFSAESLTYLPDSPRILAIWLFLVEVIAVGAFEFEGVREGNADVCVRPWEVSQYAQLPISA